MTKTLLYKLRQWNRQRNYFLKQIRLDIATWLLDHRPTGDSCATPISTILFLRDDNKFGDMVISTISFRELKKAGFQVNVVAGIHNGQVISHNQNIEQIFVHKPGWFNTLQLALQLRKKQFDLIIDVGDEVTPQHLLFIRLINAQHILGFNKKRYRLYDINIEYPKSNNHISHRHETVLQKLGIHPICLDYQLSIPHDIEDRTLNFLAKFKDQFIIVLNPFTAIPQKDLSITQITQLVQLIRQHINNVAIIIIGNAERIHQLTTQEICLFPFSEFIAAVSMIKHADLVISPDTSAVHVAAAFKKPSITLYRQDKPGDISSYEWGPNNENAVQLFSPQPFGDISSIDIQIIFNAIIDKYKNLKQIN